MYYFNAGGVEGSMESSFVFNTVESIKQKRRLIVGRLVRVV